METLNYPYKLPKPGLMLGMSLVFGLGAAVMGFIAATNDSGLVINGAHFSPRGATIFYSCVAAACAGFFVLLFPQWVLSLFGPRRLTVTATEISLTNHSFWHRVSVVPIADIKSLEVKQIQTIRFLNIHHAKGTLAINESCLPDAGTFEELCRAIADLHPGPKIRQP